MKFSSVPAPRPKLGKTWHGLNKNQGVVGKHDEQYQLNELQLEGKEMVTPKLPSWPAPLQALALVASPRLGLRQD
jgi:hypothetical protein